MSPEKAQADVDQPVFNPISKAVVWIGFFITLLWFGWGAWQRRWIADDGLIVLRTVRNLLAGNGPVFNAGERVEANTSTVWTYLIYAVAWVSHARLEYIVLFLSLVFSLGGIALLMRGSARLYGEKASGTLLLPAGVLVYIALPPARDFATSGLESSLVIGWLGLLWWMLIRWSQLDSDSQLRYSARSVLPVAFLAGLSVLVRPELALIGVAALAMLVLSPISWLLRLVLVLVAGTVPVGYQIWRMGYYALPVPNTAIAKDASGSKWSQGWIYLTNFVQPYALWFPIVLLAVFSVLLLVIDSRITHRRFKLSDAEFPSGLKNHLLCLSHWLQSPTAVVVFMVTSGVLQGMYWLRQGGDFMHGRVLLTPLFCIIAPVAVLPVRIPETFRLTEFSRAGFAFAPILLWGGVVAWAIIAANSHGMNKPTTVSYSGIVDERQYYATNTGHSHPILAEDYLDYPRMRPMLAAIAATPEGGLVLPAVSYTYWDVIRPYDPIKPEGNGHTVFFLNLGMTSMNVGLDVRVVDQMGLAYPLASHTERLKDARIGHDKNLYPDWVVADSPVIPIKPWLPWYMDEDWVTEARTALTCPQTKELIESYTSDLTFARFKQNFKKALAFSQYRIDRVPKYEIERCGLIPPVLKNPD
ncbi:MAG: flagellar motor control protein ZomB [Mycobacteriaceae bacterium]